MRFERLAVPSYGPFTGLALDFPEGAADFHVIYGANEAGKSSLLRAIRDLLFGIHGQTPDNFLHEYKKLRISARIANAAGDRLAFQRRKGIRDTLLDEAGHPVPDEILRAYLGAVDRNYFTTVFGLGADELRQGAELLLQGQGELGEALFSASLAGTPVHRVLDALEQEARTLFDGRAQRNVSIRPEITRYRESLRDSRDAVIRPESWEEALRQLDQLESGRDQLDARLTELRTRRDWLQRCLAALPTLGVLAEEEARRAELPPVPDLGPDFVVSAEKAIDERNAAQESLAQLDRSIVQLEEAIRDHQPAVEIMEAAADIEGLHQNLAVYRDRNTRLQDVGTELEQLETELLVGIHELDCGREPKDVEQLRFPLVDELAMREAGKQLEQTEQRLQDSSNELNSLRGEVDRTESKLEGLAVDDVTALSAALSETAGADAVARGLSRRRTIVATARNNLEMQRGLLPGTPSEHRAVFELPVPLAATLREFDREASRIDAARAHAEEAISVADERLDALRAERCRIRERNRLPSVDDLTAARARRDTAWDSVLSAWESGASQGELDGEPLTTAYPGAVKRADAIADQLREDAEAVARVEELTEQVRRSEEQGEKAREALQRATTSLADWDRRWAEAWSDSGIAPGRPAEMIEWRDHWREFRARYEAWEQASEELKSAQTQVASATTLLGPLTGGNGEMTLQALRTAGERRIRAADEISGKREELLARRSELAADLRKLTLEQPALIGARDTARSEWNARCEDLGFPSDLRPEVGLAMLDRRKEIVELYDRWAGKVSELKGLQKQLGQYRTDINAVADRVGIAAGTVEARDSALWSAFEEARRREAVRQQRKGDLERDSKRRPQLQRISDQGRKRLSDCTAQAGLESESDLVDLLSRLRIRHEQDQTITRLRERLREHALDEPLDAFVARARAEPGDAVKAERDALGAEISAAEVQRDEILQALAVANRNKADLEQSGDNASEKFQEARNSAARIHHDAGRYLRLQLSIHFLRQQIERFRKDNQAPMLKRSGELFRAMTEGSFDGLGIGFAQDDTQVLVGERDGREVDVKGMSEGTRDQLYLALRLAAIERHQAHREPMPLILDDVLVTFDDQRARALLPLLRDLGKRSQVLLFTHHRHVLELAGERLPENAFHVLEL